MKPMATITSRAAQFVVRAGIGLVRPSLAAPRHRPHSRRSRKGVTSASRLDTLRSCFRTRFSSLPW